MFGGVSRTARVRLCPEATLRSTKRTRLWASHQIFDLTKASARRWQSSGSHLAEATETPQEIDKDISRPSEHPREQTNLRYKHWQPNVDLGVEALGKPADVLILPPRERRTRRAHRTDQDPIQTQSNEATAQAQLQLQVQDLEVGNVTINQVIKNESKPVSWGDVKRNIESLRLSMARDHGLVLDNKTWKELKKALATGFTKEQLHMYLTSTLDPTESKPKTFALGSKKSLATRIMQRAWNMRSSSDQEPSPRLDALKIKRIAMTLLLADRRHFLKQVSNKFGVRVDVFRESSALHIIGPDKSIEDACTEIQGHIRSLQHMILRIDAPSQQLLNSSIGTDYLDLLMQRQAVHVNREKNSIHLDAFLQKDLHAAARDIIQALENSDINVHTSLSSGIDNGQVTELLFHPSHFRHWLLERQKWYRDSVMVRVAKKLDSPKDSSSRLLNTLLRTSLLSPNANLQYYDVGELDVQRTLSVHLGQLLHGQVSSEQVRSRTMFSAYIPRLPQLLKGLRIHDESESTHGPLFRFRFKPLHAQNSLPTFEILATGADCERGTKQQLHIKQISVVIGSQVEDIKVPQSSVDMRFVLKTTITVFAANGPAPQERCLKLLQDFGSFLEQVQSNDRSVEIVRHLDMSSLLKKSFKARSPEQRDPQEQNSGNIVQITSTIPNTGQMPRKMSIDQFRRLAQETHYVFEGSELVDSTSYQVSAMPTASLRHTMYESEAGQRSECRQSLEVVERANLIAQGSTMRRHHKQTAPGGGSESLQDRHTRPVAEALKRVIPAAVKIMKDLDDIQR